MSQHADGSLITMKPYISSSHYLRKMSDFSEGEWCRIWDGLQWRFTHRHRDFFEKSLHEGMINQIDRMGKERMKKHVVIASYFPENV